MVSLLIRNLIYTLLLPGTVVVLLPYVLLVRNGESDFSFTQFHHFTGVVLFSFGMWILISCILRFAYEGKGTLSPLDPTRKLVVRGLYRISRNPMYLGVITMLTGEAVFFRSMTLWMYLAIIFFIFNLFIVFFEEPRLKKDFGRSYIEYNEKVRRWI